MGNLRNSHDIRNQVSLYFDNALGENESKELLQKVDTDPKCHKIFNKEKTFREFIKNNVTRPTVSTDFIESIKNKVRY